MRETSHSEAPARVMAGGEAGDSSGRLSAAVSGTGNDLLQRAPLLTTAGGGGGGAGPRSRCRYGAGVEGGMRDRRCSAAAAARAPRPFPQAGPPRSRRRRSPQAPPAILWQRGEQGRPSSGAGPVLMGALTLAVPAVFPCRLVAKCGICQYYFKSGCSLM